MRLLSSIDTFIQNCSNAVATSDYKLLRRSLKAFLDGRETDVLRLAQPWFIDQFLDFLIVNYRSNKTRGHDLTHEQASTTAMRYLKTLRKYVNHLIAVGEFPDLDIFEGTKLAHHFKRQRRKAPSPILTLELDPSSKRLVSPTAMKAAVQMAAGWDFFLCGADPLTLADDDFDDASRKIFLRPFNPLSNTPRKSTAVSRDSRAYRHSNRQA